MAVKLITGSSGKGPNCMIQNPDRRNFTGNTEATPLMSASTRFDFNIERDEVDKSRDFEKSGDGHFPATRFNYDQREHANHMETGVGGAHHMVTKQNAPLHNIPEFLTGRSTQNIPLPQQFTQPQNMTPHISIDSTCFTRQRIANCRADTKNTKFRFRETYQQTCQSNCRYWVSTTTPDVVNITQTDHDEYTKLRRQKWQI